MVGTEQIPVGDAVLEALSATWKFTVVARRHLPLGEAHDIVEHMAEEIAATIPGAYVVVPLGHAGLSGRALRSLGAAGRRLVGEEIQLTPWAECAYSQ